MSESKEAFSRLMALSKLNVVPNYERIRSKTAFVIGVGGVGGACAEMLVRAGIGRLYLFDYDKVELVNMNRMFFTPDQVGMLKVEAAKATLEKISMGNCEIFTFNGNICSVDDYRNLTDLILKEKSVLENDAKGVLVLCCVDNYAARVTINRACLETNQVWLESGVSETAVSAHVQLMQPGVSACFDCAPPVIVASGGDEKTIVRPGVCAASLPTTMSIVAGIMVQACLKYFLGFGSISGCIGYDALSDYFPVYDMRPNPECSNDICRKLQILPKPSADAASQNQLNQSPGKLIAHDSNEWGISVLETQESPSVEDHKSITEDSHVDLNELSLEELRNRLKRK